MVITVKCPNPACGRKLTLAAEHAGKPVKCGFCQQVFQAPPASPAVIASAEGAKQSHSVIQNPASSIQNRESVQSAIGNPQ